MILLTFIALYGTVASVPVGFLALGLIYGLIGLGVYGPPALFLAFIQGGLPRWLSVLGWIAIVIFGGYLTYLGSFYAYDWITHTKSWNYYGRTIIYQLPAFEMTELQFYSWWPLQLVLMLFVVNMVWATIRRIEFNLQNLGVLTVHTGIVTLAVGSILYSSFKVEGDTILFRRDLGGGFEKVFYDAVNPAVFVTLEGYGNAMLPVPDLPRYNDYHVGMLDMSLTDRYEIQGLLPEHVGIRVVGFYPDAEIEQTWAMEPADAPDAEVLMTSPAVKIALATRETPDTSTLKPEQLLLLAADVPGERYETTHHADIELLTRVSERRVRDLMEEFAGDHGLIVEIPGTGYREVFSIQEGQLLNLGETGYRLAIEEIGPYGLPFVTPGYEEATDTRAVVRVELGDEVFRRITMHRFPERSQDFVPQPDNPNVGPLGQRRDPDPSIRLVYLDRSKPQFRILWDPETPEQPFELLAHLPNSAPLRAPLVEDRFPIGRMLWVHLLEASQQAAKVRQPAITPRPQRDPKDIGGYTAALMVVEVTAELPDGSPFRELVMLHHMRYPRYPAGKNQPETVAIPGVGEITLAFARQQHELPFSIALDDFEMVPYPDTHPPVPRDFSSDLLIGDLHPQDRTLMRAPEIYTPSLNNPVIYRTSTEGVGWVMSKLKLSQVGWDPGDTTDPAIEARDEEGRFINQQRFSIIGVGNNVGIQIIFIGSCLMVAGVPWAFYVKPWMVQRRKRQLQEALASERDGGQSPDAAESPAVVTDASHHPPADEQKNKPEMASTGV
ncbi:hypothetical protein [Mucisphaera sp.]|uniref:hypothetical protein n=1 Tax=Mucisphaera sp. TaxID=2913024 RepID=UPI003D0BAC99